MYLIRFHDGMLSLRQTFGIDSHNLANFVHSSSPSSNGNSISGKPCCAPNATRLPSYFNCYEVDEVVVVISPTNHSDRHNSSVIRLRIVLCPCNSDPLGRAQHNKHKDLFCARTHHAQRFTDSRLHCTQMRQASSNSANQSRMHIKGNNGRLNVARETFCVFLSAHALRCGKAEWPKVSSITEQLAGTVASCAARHSARLCGL